MATNAGLKELYEVWHKQGPSSWFSDGTNERTAIINSGIPWDGKRVLEIGCGEGDLAYAVSLLAKTVLGNDYSLVAIKSAQHKFGKGADKNFHFTTLDYRKMNQRFDRVVLMGVLEHFDQPWAELDWIARNLVVKGGDIITSSPCFLNPRGIVWMTLATLFDAPMSLTDLHFLHPWEFEQFAKENDCVKSLAVSFTDRDWGYGEEMVADLRQRLPKVFPEMDKGKIARLVDWLERSSPFVYAAPGATAVYRLELK
jgi:SAM-dependent methyltransferase